MHQLFIQVYHEGQWRKVSTIRYDADHSGTGAKRRKAIEAGLLGLSDWRASDQFIGRKMRLAEVSGRWGNSFRAIVGVNG